MTDRLEAEAIDRILADFARAELGDPRRMARVQDVAERLSALPGGSLPDAMGTDAALEGAYRLFSNEHVTFEHLIDAHAKGTLERACASELVLALHDTTTCQFPHADPDQIGYLNTGKPGFLLHIALVVDTRIWKRPLGLAHAETLLREDPPRRRGTKHRRSGYETAQAANKEFDRWWRGIEEVAWRFRGTATEVVHVADRETDAYQLMSSMVAAGYRFVFRARHNRVVDDAGAKAHVGDLVERAHVRLEREVPLSRRLARSEPGSRKSHPPREARTARLCFSQTAATLRRPLCADRELPATVAVNVLHVFERDAPAGQEPVDWMLYTTEPLDTPEQIERVVDYYRCRWQIEELNKALKTGCVVQERQLESYDALTTMLALSLPIAVELLALRTLARTDPSVPARTFLSDEQLAALRHISHRPLPPHPTVRDALWCIAGLGGHIKNNGWPGWQVLQRGMQKFLAFAAGWCARALAEM
jgi:hypothetical protein